MFVSFDTKVRYKGREYSRLDEIPADLRRPLDRALNRLSPSGVLVPHLNSRILVNGRTVADPSQLSPFEQKYVEQLLQSLLPIDNAICVAAVRERAHLIRGIIGLSFILCGVIAAAGVLWSRGYFG